MEVVQCPGCCSARESPWYPFGRRLGGPQSWSGHNGEEKKSLPLLGIESQSSSPQLSLYTDSVTPASIL